MATDVVSVDVPMGFRRRGGQKVIVLHDGTQGHPAPKGTIDNMTVRHSREHSDGWHYWRTEPMLASRKSTKGNGLAHRL